METKIKIKSPLVPNFLFSEDKNIQYSISEFTDSQLEEIGKEWTKNLLKRAKGIRENNIF